MPRRYEGLEHVFAQWVSRMDDKYSDQGYTFFWDWDDLYNELGFGISWGEGDYRIRNAYAVARSRVERLETPDNLDVAAHVLRTAERVLVNWMNWKLNKMFWRKEK